MIPEITITETRDVETVWRIITDRAVFARVCDDEWLTKPIDELREIVRSIVENPENLIPLALVDGQLAGCFICYAQPAGVFEVHTFMLPSCRGASAVVAGRAAMKFVFQNPDVKKLVSMCPVCLPESHWFARRCGWRTIGVASKNWLKDGIDHVVMLVEATKEDLCR